MDATLPPAVVGNPSIPDREVLTELNGLHARTLRRMPWIQGALMPALSLVVYTPAVGGLFIAWAISNLAVECLRARYATSVLRAGDAFDPRRVHGVLVALAALAGFTMGAGAALLMARLPILDQSMLGVFVFAMPAAGVAVSQSSRYIAGAYTVSMLVPAAGAWMSLHPTQAVAVGTGTAIFCILMVLVAADGDQLLRRSVLIRHERDRLIQDLERKGAEVQAAMKLAEAAALARGRVLAAASHDLRQPLHALSVYSAVLTAKPEPEVLAEVGGHIVEIVRSLGSVLNGLLDLSRLSSGSYLPVQQRLELDKILAPVCAEFVAAARAKRLDFDVALAPVMVCSDPVAIARIARNLIDNAIKYTDAGSIRVATGTDRRAEGARALLTVSDTGKGIEVADRTRIFEEFYQVGNPGRDRNQGVGLGLAIVQRLVELLDGRISVSSEPGAGSSFELSLPALSTAESSLAASSVEEVPDIVRGRRVYVVDDEADVLRGTRALLSLWGLEVQCAGSAAAAEHLCATLGPPDLLIADLRLSDEEHGAQLAARLQQRFGMFPVLIISGETSSAAFEEASRRAFPMVHKPVTPESFRAAVALALTVATGGPAAAGVTDARGPPSRRPSGSGS